MIKQFYIFRNLKDNILRSIEIKAGQLYNWALDKRCKEKYPDEWIKGYKEWKKRGCPHN
tara:strand:+ start:835 stop:1011 length:177 start_codon:yes stop_codon:yes gene_type:complete